MTDLIEQANYKYSLADALRPNSMDLSIIRERIFNMLPENYKGSSEMVTVLETLLDGSDNKASGVEQDQLIYLFADKFVSSIEKLSSSVVNTPEYALACKFVGYTSIGFSNSKAWEFVFPDKADEIIRRNEFDLLDESSKALYDEKIKVNAEAFANRQLVQTIMEVSNVQMHTAYAPIAHKAVNKLVYLMENSSSEKIQLGATIALLDKVVKPPELGSEKELEAFKDGTKSILDAFKEMSKNLSKNATESIESGNTSITDVIELTAATAKES